MAHTPILASVAAWARGDENIRLAILTGSAAEDPPAADSLSDLDIELYVRDPAPLLQDSSWHAQFGDLLVAEELANRGWNPTRLLYYVDAKIDFTIIDVAHVRQALHDRPFRVVLDRDGLAAHLAVKTPTARRPTADEVDECAAWFYAAALMEAKQLVRAELWQAKFREWDLLRQLLRMIEWDQRARHGWDYDTWFNGKHFDAWADPDLRTAAVECWSQFDANDMQRALLATIALFARLDLRVRGAVNVAPFHHDKLRKEIDRLLRLRRAR